MAGNIVIKLDQADVERVQQDLRHINNGMPTAVVRAINRGVDGVRTDMTAIARRVYTVKASAIRGNIYLAKASLTNMTAYAKSTGKPIKLIDFAVRPSTPQPKRKNPYQAEVIKGQPKPVQHGFVAVMQSGHRGVFKRTGKKRLPIRELYGPRVEDLYARPEYQQELQAGADKRIETELIRQADYIFKQRNGLL